MFTILIFASLAAQARQKGSFEATIYKNDFEKPFL